NLSNFPWGANVNLSYHWYDGAGKVLSWDGLRTSLAGMRPNDLRTVNVRVAVPTTAGTYTLRYDIVQEGVTWFSDAGMQTPSLPLAVAVAGYAASYAPATPAISGVGGTTITVPVTITNVGSVVWQPGVINASYHI